MIPIDTPVISGHVESQLKRMLAEPRFTSAPRQSNFLKLVVERAIKGEKSPEELIGEILFPGFIKDESTDVRTTASNLRSSIQKYYANEGFGDLVRIALPEPPKDRSIKLPPGDAYTPRFSYNPNHLASLHFRLGEQFLWRVESAPVTKAIEHFQRVLEIVPDHLGALIGVAEAITCIGDVVTDAGQKTSNFASADVCLTIAEALAPKYWRAHAARGFLLQVQGELELADRKYSEALKLDFECTESYLHYQHFLVLADRMYDHLETMERLLYRHIEDVETHVAYATALIGVGNLTEAENVLKKGLELDPNCASIRSTLALLYATQNRSDEAFEQLDFLKDLVEPFAFEFISANVKERLARGQSAASGSSADFLS